MLDSWPKLKGLCSLGAGTNSSATLRVTIPSFCITKHISRVYYCANTSVQKYCTKNVMQAPAKFSASALCKEGLICAKLNAIARPVCKQLWCKNIAQTWCTQFFLQIIFSVLCQSEEDAKCSLPWQCLELHLFWVLTWSTHSGVQTWLIRLYLSWKHMGDLSKGILWWNFVNFVGFCNLEFFKRILEPVSAGQSYFSSPPRPSSCLKLLIC